MKNENYIDKDGLTVLNKEKIGKTFSPYYLNYNDQLYDLRYGKYFFTDIDANLYKILLGETNKNAQLRIRLSDKMKSNGEILTFQAYNNVKIDMNNLKKYFEKVEKTKSITYNEDNMDKFIMVLDPKSKFIHIYEFKSDNNQYTSKYIHCVFDYDENCISHMDYSFNTYDKNQYDKIVKNPYTEETRAKEHIKIWRLDGKIDIEDFYEIIFKMYQSNMQYIQEFFKKE